MPDIPTRLFVQVYGSGFAAYSLDPREVHDNGKPVYEYYSDASVERLKEALRATVLRVNSKDERMPYCWCNAWDWTKHSEMCVALRTFLTDTDSSIGEEK